MSKRRNENGQMRREDYEADDDDSRGGGVASDAFDIGFQRASDEAIKQRKIVKARVGGAKRVPVATAAAAADKPAAAKANPFAGFAGLTAAAAAAPPKANPFAGFAGLTANKPTAVADVSTSKPTSAPPKPVAASKPVAMAESYQTAIEVLNKDFLAFVTDQSKQNPSVSWLTAVQEYVKYADDIAATHAATKPVPAGQTRPPAVASALPSTTTSATNGSSGLSFGTKMSDDKTSASASSSAASTSTGGFSFGTKKGDDDKPAASSGFSFGTKKSNESDKPVTTPAFSFGTKPSDGKPATTSAFSFGTKKGDDDKPAASSGFSFGTKKSDESDKPATTPAFSFGGVSSSTSSFGTTSSGFSFGGGLASSTASSSSTGGSSVAAGPKPFSFGAGSGFGSAAPAAAAAVTPAPAAADDDDDENVGREEATVILKSDSLADDDTVFDVPKAKVFEFKKDEKRWADKGLHPLQVLTSKSSKQTRILVRNEIGKIVLNAAVYKGMSVKVHETKGTKTGVIVSLQVDGAMTQFLLKVNAAKVDAFVAALETAAAAAT